MRKEYTGRKSPNVHHKTFPVFCKLFPFSSCAVKGVVLYFFRQSVKFLTRVGQYAAYHCFCSMHGLIPDGDCMER